jgi:hypothetical protein
MFVSLYPKKSGFWNLYNCLLDLLPTHLVPLNIFLYDELMSHKHVSVCLLKKDYMCGYRKGT